MRNLTGAVLAAACFAGTLATSGGARADMSDAFTNTVVSRYSDGGWVKHFFNRDGSYSAEFSDGRRLSARWAQQGDRVCLSNIRPNMLIPRFCTDMVDARVGQTWQSRDPLGRRVRNTLVAGR